MLLYNGIAAEPGRPEPIDSLSVIHLGEHLERLTASDLRRLNTQVPLDVLRTVVDLATEIGREGREGKPVGTMFVVGDTKRVLTMSRPLNFNPFRGYSAEERDVRDRRVREAIKDLAQLEGAILIGRDGDRRGRVHVPGRDGRGHHAEQGPGQPALGGGGGEQEDAGDCGRGEPVVRDGADFPGRRGGAAHRAAGPAAHLAAVPAGGAGSGRRE